MLFIYLIFEKIFFDILPKEIKFNDNKISYDIFRSKKNFIYSTVKSLTRKAVIRNFLSSILVDDILKSEAYKKYVNEEEESNANLLEKNTISHKFDTKLKLNSNEDNNCTGI